MSLQNAIDALNDLSSDDLRLIYVQVARHHGHQLEGGTSSTKDEAFAQMTPSHPGAAAALALGKQLTEEEVGEFLATVFMRLLMANT